MDFIDRTGQFDRRDRSDWIEETLRDGENNPHQLLRVDWAGARNVPIDVMFVGNRCYVHWRQRGSADPSLSD